jgi:galactose oxidase
VRTRTREARPSKECRGWQLSPCGLVCLGLFAFFLGEGDAAAQVKDVVVGITATCPYGISACWAGAYEALTHLDGVESVDKNPDSNTSTAHIHLRSKALPDPEKLRTQFESLVGKAYLFRGVEITVEGSVKERNGDMTVELPDAKESLRLAALKTKVQWNFQKQHTRGPETEERTAFQDLISKEKETMSTKATSHPVVRVTGPLKMTDRGPVMEVREFSELKTGSSSHP